MATVFDAGWLFFDQVGLFKLGGEVFAYFLVDRTGRRPLFLASSSLVTVFLVILGKFMQFVQIVRLKTDHTVHTVFHHLSCMAVVVVCYHTDMEPSHPCRQCRDGVRVARPVFTGQADIALLLCLHQARKRNVMRLVGRMKGELYPAKSSL